MKQRNKNLPELKYESKVNGVRVNFGNVDIIAMRERTDTKPEKLSKGKLINVNEENGLTKRIKMSQRK